eukprot:748005-Hanusia_phi.AAC.5
MDRLRAEADELKARMQSESAGNKMELANKIKRAMDRLKRSEENAEKSLKVAQDMLQSEAEAFSKQEERFLQTRHGKEQAQKRVSSFRHKYNQRVTELRELLEEAEASKMEYCVAAAELYLEAARDDTMVGAKHQLGKLFEGRDPLPPSWIPKDEKDVGELELEDLLRYSRSFNQRSRSSSNKIR